MNLNTNQIVSISEANQNFSKVAKVAENNGQAIIFKNNKPKFILIDVDSNSYFDITDDEKIEVINVDGTVMPDNAYATENVFAKIDGSLYKISIEYPYDPINTFGRNYRADGDVLFELCFVY